MAINEEPQSAYYTSRWGIRPGDIVGFYNKEIKDDEYLECTMLHFFVDSGIKDNLYYWGEFQKGLKLYAELKKACPSLASINFGGGFPIQNNFFTCLRIFDELKSVICW